jgi:hypothetical protein
MTTSSGGFAVPRARTSASRAATFNAGARHVTTIAATVEMMAMAMAHAIARLELLTRNFISEISETYDALQMGIAIKPWGVLTQWNEVSLLL